MVRQRLALQPAWVLKATPYSDTSLLVEALTPAQGRIGLVARGARGPKSRTRVLLQPFRPLLLSWNEAGELGSLTGAETAGMPHALDGERIFSGWYLNELLLRLLARHDPHPGVVDAYALALQALSGERDEAACEAALRRFELHLLAELGFGLDWPEDLRPEDGYRWHADQGLLRMPAPTSETLSGAALIALRDEALRTPEDLLTARRLLRAMLAPLLGNRPLATAAVLRQLRQRPGVSGARRRNDAVPDSPASPPPSR